MAAKLNFGRGAYQDIGNPIQEYAAQKLKERLANQAQTNADRTFGLQEANSKRQAALHKLTMDEKSRALAQRKTEADVYSMENSSSPVAGNVNSLYEKLSTDFAGRNVEVPTGDSTAPLSPDAVEYQKRLDALNQSAIYDHFGGDATGVTQVNNVQAAPYFDGRDDALATEDSLMKKIMASGNYTAPEADKLVATEMARRFKLASADSIKATQAQNKAIFDANVKLLTKQAGSSGMSVDPETGAVSFGSGAFKTVSTKKDKPELIASTIKDIAISKDYTGTLSGKLFGETRPTEGNLLKARNVLSEMGYDDTQIATGLRSGIQYNWLTDDALASNETIAKYMGTPSASSVRTTNKAGGSGSGSISSANLDKRMELLTQDYMRRNAVAAGTGIHQGATQSRYESERPIATTPNIADTIKKKSLEGTGGVDTTFTNINNPVVKAFQSKSPTALGELFKSNPTSFRNTLMSMEAAGQGKAVNRIVNAMKRYEDGTFGTPAPLPPKTSNLQGTTVIPEGTPMSAEGITQTQMQEVNKVTEGKDNAYRSAVIDQIKLLNDTDMSDFDRTKLHAKILYNTGIGSLADIGREILGVAGKGINYVSNVDKKQSEKAVNKPYTGDEMAAILRGDTSWQKGIRDSSITRANTIAEPATESVTDSLLDSINSSNPTRQLPKNPSEIKSMRKFIIDKNLKGIDSKVVNSLDASEVISLYNRFKANI